MATKTLKVIKNVNIRKNEAHRKEDNLKGLIYQGQKFELEVTEVTGEDIDGNAIWYKDSNGDFFWSGGFEVN